MSRRPKTTILKKHRLFLSAIALLPAIWLIVTFSGRILTIFPNNETNYPFEPGVYFDSEINDLSFDNQQIKINFTLDKTIPNPGVFLSFWLDPRGRGTDLSAYDFVTLKIPSTNRKTVKLYIKTFAPGISTRKHENARALRHNERTLFLPPGVHEYKVPLKEFQTGNWWYTGFNTTLDKLGKESFSDVIAFDIHFNKRITNIMSDKKEETFTIEEISFHKTTNIGFFLSGCFFLAGALLLLLIWGLKKEKKEAPPLPYQELSVTNHKDTEADRLDKIIGQNYQNPEISTAFIAKQTGLPSARVYALVKERHNQTFKQLINEIRLTEACRLLTETDLKITEIAITVGFNDLSYFNKLFKNKKSMAPREFRLKVRRTRPGQDN